VRQTLYVDSLLHTVVSGTVKLEREKVTWHVPVAAAIATAAMVSVFIACGWSSKAVPLAIGGLFMPLAGIFEPPGRRLLTQLWTLVWMMLTTLIGGLFSADSMVIFGIGTVVSVFVAFCCGFAGGAGVNARVGGVLSLVLFAIFLGIPNSEQTAVANTLLVGLGATLVIAWLTLLRIVLHRRKPWGAPSVTPSVIERLRPRFNTRDDFFRHGVRLAGAFTTATIISQALMWPHQYWIPMTVAWVSIPDPTGTATRVASRVLGTLIGIAGITAVIVWFQPGPYAIAVLVGIGACIATAFILANYLLCVVGVTAFMISLFTLEGDPVGPTAEYRAACTIVAGLIVLAWSMVWPSVEHEKRHRILWREAKVSSSA